MRSASQPYESEVVKRFELQAEKAEVGYSDSEQFVLHGSARHFKSTVTTS